MRPYRYEVPEPWDIKLERADEHLRELGRSVRELRESGEISAVTDSTGRRASRSPRDQVGDPSLLPAIIHHR